MINFVLLIAAVIEPQKSYCVKINLVTPAKKNDRNGNRTSALRWAKLLQQLGHKVQVESEYNNEAVDLLIVLHAFRSAQSIERYKLLYPHGPLVVALGGTDINTYLKTDPEVTLKSIHLADTLVCLHDLIAHELPTEYLPKLHVIYQSAGALSQQKKPRIRTFDVCVIGNLRPEKDPFRTVIASQLLPIESRIRVVHLGKAINSKWQQEALKFAQNSPRYYWRGEVPKWQVRQELSRTRIMVISSNQEGGANVISEALMAGVPIIASKISGNVGLLGADYPGYFELGNEKALAKLLYRAETDPVFLSLLERSCVRLALKFTAEFESLAWQSLLNQFR
jgi:putative glycosyltransferase (TIGR04348 family)|tara:strand:- start:2460 stop:3470 length:1011 start_codon:yes stop_codon:yes gene_type:complete